MKNDENMLSLDLDIFHDYTDNNKQAAITMANLFIEQAQVYLGELHDSMMSPNTEEWRDIAHKFKGMASFSGTQRLYHLCKQAQDNHKTSDKTAMFQGIKAEVTAATAAFQSYLLDKGS